MASLHGILAELGIESPSMHPEREVPHALQWIADEEFMPLEGRSYEVIFARLNFDGQHRHVLKRIRTDGAAPGRWFDLDAAEPLDIDLQTSLVKAFRSIE